MRKLRWILAVLAVLAGAASLGLALYIEDQVRWSIGKGTTQGMAYLFYRESIHDYRRTVAWYALLGPTLWCCAWLIWPRLGVAARGTAGKLQHATPAPSPAATKPPRR